MAGSRPRRLLHGRYYFMGKAKKERYYDTIAHRSISSNEYRTKVRGHEEGHKRQRRLRAEAEQLPERKRTPSQRLRLFKDSLAERMWYKLQFDPYYHDKGYFAESGKARRKADRDEHRIRKGELKQSRLYRRVLADLQTRELGTGPNSQFARGVEWLGRPEEAFWNVGDTPKIRQGGPIGRPTAATRKQVSAYDEYMRRTREGRRSFIEAGAEEWYQPSLWNS